MTNPQRYALAGSGIRSLDNKYCVVFLIAWEQEHSIIVEWVEVFNEILFNEILCALYTSTIFVEVALLVWHFKPTPTIFLVM